MTSSEARRRTISRARPRNDRRLKADEPVEASRVRFSNNLRFDPPSCYLETFLEAGCWYTVEQLDAMSRSADKEAQEEADESSGDHTMRGLEHLVSDAAFDNVIRQVKDVVNSVLTEQRFQRDQNISNEERIRYVSRKFSKNSREAAEQFGAVDSSTAILIRTEEMMRSKQLKFGSLNLSVPNKPKTSKSMRKRRNTPSRRRASVHASSSTDWNGNDLSSSVSTSMGGSVVSQRSTRSYISSNSVFDIDRPTPSIKSSSKGGPDFEMHKISFRI
uniref:Uncharacterized protein n=1 Tax=Attheya septentrionalis TaxID=420275 RepID=A0A7S2UH05_9STRA|mmetsp:Transcript_25511/g.46207  ORF Transcript_25511/g.46207 Transcript_25511/m.46207 type:complete len:274 (+) Transcript_25511:76-897(+)